MNEKTDHDILIRVETKVEGLTDEVRLMRDGVKEQITSLQSTKVDKTTFDILAETVDKHDKLLVKYGWLIAVGVGIILTMQFVTIIVSSLSKNTDQGISQSK